MKQLSATIQGEFTNTGINDFNFSTKQAGDDTSAKLMIINNDGQRNIKEPCAVIARPSPAQHGRNLLASSSHTVAGCPVLILEGADDRLLRGRVLEPPNVTFSHDAVLLILAFPSTPPAGIKQVLRQKATRSMLDACYATFRLTRIWWGSPKPKFRHNM